MRAIHTEIDIGASAPTVWAVLIDTAKWAEWNPFAKLSGRVAVGERVSVTLTPPGTTLVAV